MKDERIYLGHIRDAINDIDQYTSAGRDAFMAERMRQDAVIRKLEIGNAMKRPDRTLRDFHFLGIEAWGARGCRANRQVAHDVGLLDDAPRRRRALGTR